MSKHKPMPPEAHDVLLIPRLCPAEEKTPDGRAKMLVMQVREDGGYNQSHWMEGTEPGARKVYNIARPSEAGDAHPRGPGFAILPIRPDPGSQYNTCFLINTENLFLPNPWTAADWDALDPAQEAATPTKEPQSNARWRKEGFDMLVAAPGGRVFHVRGGERHAGGSAGASVEEIDLHDEPEIWAQLREGVVVGTVWCVKLGRVLPIVNATALDVDGEREGGKP